MSPSEQRAYGEAHLRNLDAVRRQLAAISAGDVETAVADLAPDMVYEAPYYGLEAKGFDTVKGMFSRLPERFSSVSYEITEHFPTVDPNLVIVAVRGNNAVSGTDRYYRNHYIMFVYFRDGKIVRWTEYSNPLVYNEAVGS